MKSIFCRFLAIFVGTITSNLVLAADTSCDLNQSISQFELTLNQTLQLSQKLVGDIAKCFNPGNKKYMDGAQSSLAAASAEYSRDLALIDKAYRVFQGSRDSVGLEAAINQISQTLPLANKPIVSQSSNLMNYGFTTSDRMENSQYKYPACNSTNNDNPTGNWKIFYANLGSLNQQIIALQKSATCW